MINAGRHWTAAAVQCFELEVKKILIQCNLLYPPSDDDIRSALKVFGYHNYERAIQHLLHQGSNPNAAPLPSTQVARESLSNETTAATETVDTDSASGSSSSQGNKRKDTTAPEQQKKVSRITIAAKADGTFDINKSQSIVSSLSEKDSLSLDEVKSGLEHIEQCIKYQHMKGDNNNEVVDLELKKTNLLCRFLRLHFDIKPSKEGYPTGKRRSRMSDEEKEQESTLKTWNVDLHSKLCSLERSIDIVQKSGMHANKIDELLQSYELFKRQAIDATKRVSSVNSKHPFVKFMEENAVHTDLVQEAETLLSEDPSTLSPCQAVMQDKLILCNLALSSKMDPETFLEKWNVLEAKDEVATRGVVCEEGLYDEDGQEVIAPGTTWMLNKMHGLTMYALCIAVKHWHPPSESGKPNFQNGCVTAVTEMDPRMMHLEGGGGEMTSELHALMNQSIVVFDMYDIFPKQKSTWKLECKEFARLNGMTLTRLVLRSMTRIQSQCLLNTLNKQVTRCGVFTADGFRVGYDFLGASASQNVITGGPLAHGEPQGHPEKKMSANTYSMNDLENQSAALVILLSIIPGLRVSSMSQVMAIIARRHGEEKLSPEQQKIFDDALKQQRIDNGKKAYATAADRSVGLPAWHENATAEERSDNAKKAYKTMKENETGLAAWNENATAEERSDNAKKANETLGEEGRKKRSEESYNAQKKNETGLAAWNENATAEERRDNGKAAYKTMKENETGLAAWNENATAEERRDNGKAAYKTMKENETGLAAWHENATDEERAFMQLTLGTGRSLQQNKSGKVSLTDDQIIDHLFNNHSISQLEKYCGNNYLIAYCAANNIAYDKQRWPRIELLLAAAIANAQKYISASSTGLAGWNKNAAAKGEKLLAVNTSYDGKQFSFGCYPTQDEAAIVNRAVREVLEQARSKQLPKEEFQSQAREAVDSLLEQAE